MDLAKRTAGTPLSEAELEQRREAAKARWAAAGAVAGAAAGGVGAAKVLPRIAARAAAIAARRAARPEAEFDRRATRVSFQWLERNRERLQEAVDRRKSMAHSFTQPVRAEEVAMSGDTPEYRSKLAAWEEYRAKIAARKPGPKRDLALERHLARMPTKIGATARLQASLKRWRTKGSAILELQPSEARDAVLEAHLKSKPRVERISGVARRVRQIRRSLGSLPARMRAIDARLALDEFDHPDTAPGGNERRHLTIERRDIEGRMKPLADERDYLLRARPRQTVERRDHTVTRRKRAPAEEVQAMADELQRRHAAGELDAAGLKREMKKLPVPVHAPAGAGPASVTNTLAARTDALKSKLEAGAISQETFDRGLGALSNLVNMFGRGRTVAAGRKARQEKIRDAATFPRSGTRAKSSHRDISERGMRRISQRVREEADRIGSKGKIRLDAKRPARAAELKARMQARFHAGNVAQVRSRFSSRRVRALAIGGGALLGGIGGYFGARALAGDKAEKLAKAFDPSKHGRDPHGRFAEGAPSTQTRSDVAALSDPPRITMLIGMPGSGKTTWRAMRMAQDIVRPTTVISTDDQVDNLARKLGVGYSAAFRRLDIRQLERDQNRALKAAVARGHDIIVDRVNASANGRAKVLRQIPAHYQRHAVVFDVPQDELARRRAQRAGKIIPGATLAQMQAAWSAPRPGEFDQVHTVTPATDQLAKAAKKDPLPSREEMNAAADRAHAAISKRLAQMFGTWKGTIEDQMLRPGGTTVHQAMTADLQHAMAPIAAAAQAGADQPVPVESDAGGAKSPQVIAVTLLGRTPEVQDYIDQYRQDRIVALADEQRSAIKVQLIDAAKTGASPQEMAKRIKELVGLSPAQMGYVVNYRAELEALDPKALTRVLRDRRFDKAIGRAVESGNALGADDIDRYVDAYSRRFLAHRATTIARTESVGAANNGHMAAVETYLAAEPGYEVEKTWVARQDEHTRHDHHELHGKTVLGMDTPFVCDSGDEVRWPHDPGAAARQVINCRCTIATRLVPRDSAGDSADAN